MIVKSPKYLKCPSCFYPAIFNNYRNRHELFSRKISVKVTDLRGAATEDIYKNIKLILKRNPMYIILHIGTNDSSKKTPNEVLDKIFLWWKVGPRTPWTPKAFGTSKTP